MTYNIAPAHKAKSMSTTINTAPPSPELLPCPGNYVATAPTSLKCAHCTRPLMVKDAKRTHNGYVCPHYVKSRVATFYNASPLHHALLGLLMLVAGVVVGFALQLVPSFLGFYLMFIVGPALGAGLAELARRVFRKTRGQYFWLVAAVCVTIGALLVVGLPLLRAAIGGGIGVGLSFGVVPLLGLVLAVGTLIARMRI